MYAQQNYTTLHYAHTMVHMYARALGLCMPSVMGGIRPYAPHQAFSERVDERNRECGVQCEECEMMRFWKGAGGVQCMECARMTPGKRPFARGHETLLYWYKSLQAWL